MATVTGPDAAANLQGTRDSAFSYLSKNRSSFTIEQFNNYQEQITEFDQQLQVLLTMQVIDALSSDALWSKVQNSADGLKKALDALEASEKANLRALTMVQVAVLLVTGIVGQDPAAIWATVKKIHDLLNPTKDAKKNVLQYFDIYANVRKDSTVTFAPPLGIRMNLFAPLDVGGPSTIPSWIPQWIALFAGVLIQPYFAGYQKTGHWSFTGFWGWLVAGAIIAIVTFPAIYRNAFDPSKPVFIQLIAIFTSGLGWNSLFASVMQAAGGGAPPPTH